MPSRWSSSLRALLVRVLLGLCLFAACAGSASAQVPQLFGVGARALSSAGAARSGISQVAQSWWDRLPAGAQHVVRSAGIGAAAALVPPLLAAGPVGWATIGGFAAAGALIGATIAVSQNVLTTVDASAMALSRPRPAPAAPVEEMTLLGVGASSTHN